MEKQTLSQFRKAGEITSKARELGARMIRVGATIRDVTEAVEEEIRRLGGMLAFPAQSSRNHIAAHYCSSPEDATKYEEGDVVKLDIGAHFDGYVADTALSVDLGGGKNAKLVEAAKAALDAAIATAGDGVPVSEIGRVVSDTIRSYGYNPIVNLTGHGVGRYVIHCGPQIPNFQDKNSRERLKAGMVIAIEPFATDGRGYIQEQGRPEVFRLLRRPAKMKGADPAVFAAIEEVGGLPFARRYLKQFPKEVVEETFMALTRAGALVRYPPLVEAPGTKVAQWEHTLYIGTDHVEVLTR